MRKTIILSAILLYMLFCCTNSSNQTHPENSDHSEHIHEHGEDHEPYDEPASERNENSDHDDLDESLNNSHDEHYHDAVHKEPEDPDHNTCTHEDHDEHGGDENSGDGINRGSKAVSDVPGMHEQDSLYGVIELKPRPFREVIRTSGQILSAQSDEYTLTAIHEGIIVFGNKSLLPGKQVARHEQMLIISSKEMIHDNISSTFQDAKNAYETALANYERAKKLNVEKITSDKDLAVIKLEYEKVKTTYDLIRRNYSAGGQKVKSSVGGFIKDIYITEGEYVTTGQPLIKLTKNRKLIVKADVPQRFFPKLNTIQSATFITVYDKNLYNTENLNGKLVSYGKTSGENFLFTPVYFEVDNIGELLAGSYIEIFLKTTPRSNCIVIPKTALLEEAGRYYVYVEKNEEFEKRYITVDSHDGFNYNIREGLQFGEHIATINPYLIKLKTISGSLPLHSHQH